MLPSDVVEWSCIIVLSPLGMRGGCSFSNTGILIGVWTCGCCGMFDDWCQSACTACGGVGVLADDKCTSSFSNVWAVWVPQWLVSPPMRWEAVT
jgi:hypothetical protein